MIKNMRVRYPELGRIRLGEKETVQRNGKAVERPKKLDTWRVTSHDEAVIADVARIYGGTPEAWSDAPDGEQFQVTTERALLPVLIPPADALSSWYERWGSGGCQRRCDGESCTLVGPSPDGKETVQLVDQACWCAERGLTPADTEAIKKGACDLATRLSVVLYEVVGLGTFMLTTGSVYAAMELPAQVRLLEGMSRAGEMVAADLCIEQRREKKAWEKFPREYPVPVLRVRQSLQSLAAAASGTGELERGAGIARALGPGQESTSSRPSTISHFPPMVRSVIITCSELGLTDEQRHALCMAVSRRVSSAKDLTAAECGQVLAAVADGSWAQMIVAGEQPTTIIEANAAPTLPGTAETPPEDPEKGAVFRRNVAAAAKRAGLDDQPAVDGIVRHATGIDRLASLVDAGDANKTLAAIKAVERGELIPFWGEDGTVSFGEKTPAAAS